MTGSGNLPEASVFAHEAMHTTFTVRIPGQDERVARGMARECFDHLDALGDHIITTSERAMVDAIAALPRALRVIARLLPLTYAIEAMQAAMGGGSWSAAWLDLLVLAGFSAGFFLLATRVLASLLRLLFTASATCAAVLFAWIVKVRVRASGSQAAVSWPAAGAPLFISTWTSL